VGMAGPEDAVDSPRELADDLAAVLAGQARVAEQEDLARGREDAEAGRRQQALPGGVGRRRQGQGVDLPPIAAPEGRAQRPGEPRPIGGDLPGVDDFIHPARKQARPIPVREDQRPDRRMMAAAGEDEVGLGEEAPSVWLPIGPTSPCGRDRQDQPDKPPDRRTASHVPPHRKERSLPKTLLRQIEGRDRDTALVFHEARLDPPVISSLGIGSPSRAPRPSTPRPTRGT